VRAKRLTEFLVHEWFTARVFRFQKILFAAHWKNFFASNAQPVTLELDMVAFLQYSLAGGIAFAGCNTTTTDDGGKIVSFKIEKPACYYFIKPIHKKMQKD
jgi:hypothetical protein